MRQPVALTKKHRALLLVLLGVVGFVPVLTQAAGWLSAAVALAALFGALAVLWHAGALRARYIALFAAALAAAAVAGHALS